LSPKHVYSGKNHIVSMAKLGCMLWAIALLACEACQPGGVGGVWGMPPQEILPSKSEGSV